MKFSRLVLAVAVAFIVALPAAFIWYAAFTAFGNWFFGFDFGRFSRNPGEPPVTRLQEYFVFARMLGVTLLALFISDFIMNRMTKSSKETPNTGGVNISNEIEEEKDCGK